MANKVANDVANEEFKRWCDAMDLDIDSEGMDVEDAKSFEKQKARVTKAIEEGHLVITDDGEARYTPYRQASGYKEPIVFHERTGADLMASDSKKRNQDVGRMYVMMAGMTGLNPGVFAGLAGADIKTCEAIWVLLMG